MSTEPVRDEMAVATEMGAALLALAQELKDAGVDHPEVDAILKYGPFDEIVVPVD